MPLFHYEALDDEGRTVVGTMDVRGEAALRDRLQSLGYTPTLVEVSRRHLREAAAPAQRARVAAPAAEGSRIEIPQQQVAHLYHQLAVLLHAGMTPSEALAELAPRIRDKHAQPIALELMQGARGGQALSDLMRRHPRSFPDGDVGLIAAAEEGGFLPQAFEMLSETHQVDVDTRRRLRVWTWFFHSNVLGLFLVIALAVFLKSMLAGFWDAESVADLLNRGLQPARRVLFLVTIPLIALYVGGLWAMRRARVIPSWRRRWHGFLLRTRFTASVHRLRAATALLRTLQLLFHAGVENVRSWETAASVVPNLVLRDEALRATEHVLREYRFADGLTHCSFVDQNAPATVAAGESAGDLENALGRVAAAAQAEEQRAVGAAVMGGMLSMVVWFFLIGGLAFAAVAWACGAGLTALGENSGAF